MYFINKKIVKSIANEIYRDAGFALDDVEGWYCIYDSENQFKDIDYVVSFAVNRDMPDECYEYKHFTICVNENKRGREKENTYLYHTTQTLNRRELADKLLEIISRYEYLKEVSA